MLRKLLLARLRSRLDELDALDTDSQHAAERTDARELLVGMEADPAAFDPVTIAALIAAIVQLIQLIRQLRNK